MASKQATDFADALLESAEDMHRTGMLGDKAYRRIIIRLLGKAAIENTKPISGPEIRKMRLRENMSQATFASRFNFTPSYISKWERGVSQPRGAALVLLNLIRRRGFEAIF
jgi:putative transcriptional regulator